jgi:hypothetical protein
MDREFGLGQARIERVALKTTMHNKSARMMAREKVTTSSAREDDFAQQI